MHNKTLQLFYERVDRMEDLESLRRELKHIEASINDPYPDDDKAGDIMLDMMFGYVRNKITTLTKKENK